MTMRIFLIWSIEHDAWWAPDECGYVTELQLAGHYPEARARELLERCNAVGTNEALIPLECCLSAPVGGPMTMARRRDGWLFTDEDGAEWLLQPTREPGFPLAISLVRHR